MGSVGVEDPWENWSYEYHEDFLPQKGTPQKLNSIDARMQNMVTRNNKLWAVHHIYIPADNPERCAVQWWCFDTDGSVLERVRIDDPGNEYSFAFPCIAVNANEDVLVGHGVFSENQYAGAGYSFKSYLDDDNTMRSYYQYKDGRAPYYKTYGGGRNRWGDYSATFVDPVHDVDFWTMFEYAELPGNQDEWGTWWAFIQPSFPPQADFTSDEILIPVGETVNFTDQTLGIPTGWSWTFSGATPVNSTDQNPVDILYDQEGIFDVMMIAENELGIDTIIKEDYVEASTTILPEVNFKADKLVPCTGETVMFTDLSEYSPIQWEWQFDPLTVSFVEGTDQTSQNPMVVFEQADTYAVTLEVWNLNGSSEKTVFEMISAGGYPPYLKETFEEESLKPEEWIIENPDDDMTWEIFDVAGSFPGNKAAGVDFFHYYNLDERDRLITPPINLETVSSAVLNFQHAYAKRLLPLVDSLLVYLSDDCGNSWTKVFAGGEDGSGNFATHPLTDVFWPAEKDDWCMSGWGARCISIDLTPWAGQSNIRIAFESFNKYGNPLFIDNIEISQYVDLDETDQVADNIRIYPNPVNEVINLFIEDHSDFSELLLINQFGQLLYKAEMIGSKSHYTIKRQLNWAPGIYYLKAAGSDKSVIKKVIFY
jgi:PKD repeat protein